jgi:hypothetical protein
MSGWNALVSGRRGTDGIIGAVRVVAGADLTIAIRVERSDVGRRRARHGRLAIRVADRGRDTGLDQQPLWILNTRIQRTSDPCWAPRQWRPLAQWP